MPSPGPDDPSHEPEAEPTRVRRALARQIVDVYAENSDLVAAGYCGSVARGTADQRSDLDLYLFWKRPQPEALESAPLEVIGGRRFTFTGIDENGDGLEQYFVGAIKIDVAHEVQSFQEELTRDVVEQHEISSVGFKNLAAIADLVPLRGEAVIERLRDRARAYPEALAAKVLQTFLHFPPIALLRLCRERQDLTGFADVLLRISGQSIACIAALNRRYFHPEAELKGALDLLDRCTTRPERLADTLRALLRDPEADRLDDLRSDLLELIGLVEAAHPSVETDRVRWLLDFQFDGSGS